MFDRRISAVLALGFAAAIGSVSDTAKAVPVTCNVTKLGWYDGDGGTVQIQCGGTYYYGFGVKAGCHVASADTRKAWFSIAQASLLTGKQVTIDNFGCAGGPSIDNVTLIQ